MFAKHTQIRVKSWLNILHIIKQANHRILFHIRFEISTLGYPIYQCTRSSGHQLLRVKCEIFNNNTYWPNSIISICFLTCSKIIWTMIFLNKTAGYGWPCSATCAGYRAILIFYKIEQYNRHTTYILYWFDVYFWRSCCFNVLDTSL